MPSCILLYLHYGFQLLESIREVVINDIKAVIDRQTKKKRIFSVFDEFSVLPVSRL